MIEVNRVEVDIDGLRALAPVDLRVRRGEAVALRGENGSGKTTLLRVIAGELAPTGGTVTVGGGPVDDRDDAFRRRLAGVIGPPPFARNLTVREQLTLIATTWGTDPGEAEASADEVAERFGVAHLAERFPHEMSSGQKQLVGLATAFVRPFDVLVLDEPERRLDADHVTTVVEQVRRAHRDGATVLIATHSDRIAAEATDRVEWLPDPDA